MWRISARTLYCLSTSCTSSSTRSCFSYEISERNFSPPVPTSSIKMRCRRNPPSLRTAPSMAIDQCSRALRAALVSLFSGFGGGFVIRIFLRRRRLFFAAAVGPESQRITDASEDFGEIEFQPAGDLPGNFDAGHVAHLDAAQGRGGDPRNAGRAVDSIAALFTLPPEPGAKMLSSFVRIRRHDAEPSIRAE